ncbi:MAG: hypothetical protein RIR97_771 [Pseudomonadota bacterium]|jgi:hypothetical protein
MSGFDKQPFAKRVETFSLFQRDLEWDWVTFNKKGDLAGRLSFVIRT